MRYRRLYAVVFVMGSVGLAIDLPSQVTQPPRRNQLPAGATGAPQFDPTTLVTVQGTLIAVDTVPGAWGMSAKGIHGTVKTASEVLPIHFGPLAYMANQKVHLVKGDVVTVSGSRVSMNTVPTLLASYAVKGKDTLRLRDASGLPLWRGMRRQPPI